LGTVVAEQAHVVYTVTDAGNQTVTTVTDTLRNISADGTATSSVTLDTDGLVGTNRLRIEVQQPGLTEPITYNNVLLQSFVVRADRTAPSFAVMIDGDQYPSDPEPLSGRSLQDPTFPFVASQPTIEVRVDDENAFKQLTDSSVVQVTFNRQPISLSDPAVTFVPASGESNTARLRFSPDLSASDTTYTLIVRAFDASGNEAADSPYQLHFRVQRAVEVESLYPYPNPMSTATQFAFRLRGADPGLIDDFRLRIFTLTGRLVREFDLIDDPGLLDGGGLRIGWNKLRWDGRDADGDLLATGVYLYKVYLRAEGRALPVNNANSIEKLVILR
jgi:hypothetical protein